MKLSKYRRWKPEEDKLLISLYQKKKLTELAVIFNRHWNKVCRRALALGIRKDKNIWAKEISKSHKKLFKEGKRIITGENNSNWKGKKAGYHAIHQWMTRTFGKPKKCEICGKTKKVQWANKTGKYLRDRNDWMHLCIWCHIEHDKTSIQYQRPATEWRKRGSKKLLSNK